MPYCAALCQSLCITSQIEEIIHCNSVLRGYLLSEARANFCLLSVRYSKGKINCNDDNSTNKTTFETLLNKDKITVKICF